MRVQRDVCGWTFEAYTDVRCLMFGVNWAFEDIRAFYLHIGPVIIGFHQWQVIGVQQWRRA